MAIDPLQAIVSATVLPERLPRKKTGNSSFDALLDTAHTAGERPGRRNVLAEAELLRAEMMQNCLSLSDSADAPQRFRSQALAALLNGLAENGRPARTTIAV